MVITYSVIYCSSQIEAINTNPFYYLVLEHRLNLSQAMVEVDNFYKKYYSKNVLHATSSSSHLT